jgi:DNA-binding transcriptional regulator YiaG
LRSTSSSSRQRFPAKSVALLNSSDAKIKTLFDNLENEQLLTAEELAKRLNIAVKTVRKWRYENVLPSDSMVKLRHQVRYRWGKVLGWLGAKGT